jgi:hypothetical protein
MVQMLMVGHVVGQGRQRVLVQRMVVQMMGIEVIDGRRRYIGLHHDVVMQDGGGRVLVIGDGLGWQLGVEQILEIFAGLFRRDSADFVQFALAGLLDIVLRAKIRR